MKYDLVICTIPFLSRAPQTGPALIKAAVEKAGFKCKVLDWNLEIWNFFKDTYKEFDWGEKNVIRYTKANMKKFSEGPFTVLLNKWIEDIKHINPPFLGFSIYSYRTSNIIFEVIAKAFRKALPNVKIIVGGHACSIPSYDYGKYLFRKGYVDYFVNGEGELATISILKQEQHIPGVNRYPVKQLDDLDSIPFPDYTDTPPMNYPSKMMYIISSRGCIRNCNFCDNHFKKVRFRSSDSVVDEIEDIHKKYNMKRFMFADAATNGNVKQLKGITKGIIKKVEQGSIPDIFWAAFMICRSRLVMNSEIYRLMKQSGCRSLSIGIESGSYKVRADMNKKIKDEDIYFLVEECRKNKINLVDLNFIVGYYTETESDFQKTIDFLSKIKYCLKDIKISICLGPTFKVPSKWDGKVFKKDKHNNWYYKNNTFPVRVDRWFRLKNHAQNLGFGVLDNQRDLILEDLKKYDIT